MAPDLEFIRSHILLISAPPFANRLFVPDWISGDSDLIEQQELENHSKSRQRDRRLLVRNGIDHLVTTDFSALNYFYDQMYVPHIKAAHGDAALFMSRDKMLQYVHDSKGELLVIRLHGKAVAGSFVVYEKNAPRLFSGGVLDRDQGLLRKGVGSAIYLLSFDHLRSKGYKVVNMGRTRPFLSDGGLYFKQRFGLTLTDVSRTGMLLPSHARTPAAADFFGNNGLIHFRKGALRGALLETRGTPEDDSLLSSQEQLAYSLGINELDTIFCDAGALQPGQRTSNVNVAQNDS